MDNRNNVVTVRYLKRHLRIIYIVLLILYIVFSNIYTTDLTCVPITKVFFFFERQKKQFFESLNNKRCHFKPMIEIFITKIFLKTQLNFVKILKKNSI
jgi:hypothetical protein